jgi:hypothetical protein
VIEVRSIHHCVEIKKGRTVHNVEVELMLDGERRRTTREYSEVMGIEGGKEALAKFGSTFIPSGL